MLTAEVWHRMDTPQRSLEIPPTVLSIDASDVKAAPVAPPPAMAEDDAIAPEDQSVDESDASNANDHIDKEEVEKEDEATPAAEKTTEATAKEEAAPPARRPIQLPQLDDSFFDTLDNWSEEDTRSSLRDAPSPSDVVPKDAEPFQGFDAYQDKIDALKKEHATEKLAKEIDGKGGDKISPPTSPLLEAVLGEDSDKDGDYDLPTIDPNQSDTDMDSEENTGTEANLEDELSDLPETIDPYADKDEVFEDYDAFIGPKQPAPIEPYDIDEPRPSFDYKVQKLPAEIYKKYYSQDNVHLAPAMYEKEYELLFFDSTKRGDMKGLRALLSKIEHIDILDPAGNSPLLKAVQFGQINAVRFMLAHQANPNLRNRQGLAPIHYATLTNRPDIIQELVDSGADVTQTDLRGKDAIAYAYSRGYRSLIPLLSRSISHIDKLRDDGGTSLIHAIRLGRTQQVGLLLDQEADPNIRDQDGYTPLMIAAYNGLSDVSALLLKHGADPLLQDAAGRTASTFAKLAGHTALASFLINQEVGIQLRQQKQLSTPAR